MGGDTGPEVADDGVGGASSSSEHVLRMARSMSVTEHCEQDRRDRDIGEGSLFSPTNGNDQVNTSMKLGSQYG